LKNAAGAKTAAGSAEWTLASLRPGEQKVLSLTVTAAQLTDRAVVSAVALADGVQAGEDGAKPPGGSIEGRGETTTAVIGTPALVLELATPPGLVEVGKRASFQVRLRNKGTVSVHTVDLTTTAPPELKVVRAAGKVEGRIDANGGVTFPTLDEIKPGEVATFTIDVDAVKKGDARFHAEVRAAYLKVPLKEEQALQVVGGP
jgi:hypothetical protein